MTFRFKLLAKNACLRRGLALSSVSLTFLKALLREQFKRPMLAWSRFRHAQVLAADQAVREALAVYRRHPTLTHAREGYMHTRALNQALASNAAIAAARRAQMMLQHYSEQ